MDILLSILAVLLVIVGIVGCVVPVLPGQFLAYGAMVCCYFCSFSHIPTRAVWIYLVLAVVVTVLDFTIIQNIWQIVNCMFLRIFGKNDPWDDKKFDFL